MSPFEPKQVMKFSNFFSSVKEINLLTEVFFVSVVQFINSNISPDIGSVTGHSVSKLLPHTVMVSENEKQNGQLLKNRQPGKLPNLTTL